MEEELKKLVHKRGLIKSRLTKFNTYLDGIDNQPDIVQIQTRLAKIENSLEEFDELQTQIELLGDTVEAQDDERDSFEDSYYHVVSKAKKIVQNNMESRSTSGLNHNTGRPLLNNTHLNSPHSFGSEMNSQSEVQVRLPVINLPTFSGAYDEWQSFSEGFQALIHQNNTLSDIHKFYYLRSCLKDEAASVIHSLETSSSNYSIAWNLLKDRFENKRLIINKYVSSLFNYPKIDKETANQIRHFLDHINKNIRALQALGQSTDQWDTLLIHLNLSKLPSVTIEEWEKSCKPKSLPAMSEFLLFLENKCHILETLENQGHLLNPNSRCIIKSFDTKKSESQAKNSKVFTFKHQESKKMPNQSTFVSTDTCIKVNCELCKKDHKLFSCESFLKLPVRSRIDKVKDLRICLNCFKPGHNAYDCRSSSCKVCGKKHNTLLHISKDNQLPSKAEESPSTHSKDTPTTNKNTEQEPVTINQTSHSVTSFSHILLPTAIVNVEDNSGNLVPCRVLLDSGSQCNFITEHMTQVLQLKKQRVLSSVTGLGQLSTNSSKLVKATIRSCTTKYSASLDCIVLPKITVNIPSIPLDVSNWKLPEGIELADPNCHKPNKIDMLIGSEIFMNLLCTDHKLPIRTTHPTLTNTKLGWVVSGKTLVDPKALNNSSLQLCHFISNDHLNNQLQRFWSLDEVNPPSKFSGEDLKCEEHYQRTTKRDISGKYIVSMPFRDNPTQLGDSYSLAKNRLEQLEKRFSKNLKFEDDYSNFIHEYYELGHMERVNEQDHNVTPAYYIPHHAVFKESSSSTKLRVVFDCSAKPTDGQSLNNILLVGPCIQQDLFSIICRFRTHNYVISADIEKMYRQILIDELQQDLLRILWRDQPTDKIQIFKLKTVTYGSACAPYLATRTLQQLAEDEKFNFPKASSVLTRDFYMDDLLTGGSSVDEVKHLQIELISLLERGGFKLRKWASNHQELTNHLSKADIENKGHFDSEHSTKTLGLLWSSITDNFHYSLNRKDVSAIVTKREILSEISQVFDPLGLISPVIVQAKIFIQGLWQSNLHWDDPLTTKQLQFWKSYIEELNHIQRIKTPRRVLMFDQSTNIQIHGFSDSSELAFGACIYIRQEDPNGCISVRLLCSKSRVAPVKKTTLPRLELCAALLLAQLVHKVVNILNLSFQSCTLWSDSSIVLAWLNSPSSRWKTFVANRVSEIQELTQNYTWHHCRSEDNPADIISRGMPPSELLDSKKWWNGPSWLGSPVSSWPSTETQPEQETIIEERKITLTSSIEETFIEDLSSKYSSFVKLQRVLAFCLRFTQNIRSTDKHFGPLTVQELENAHLVIIKSLQKKYFQEEILSLRNGNCVSRRSKLKALQPFLDENDVLRVGGRLQYSSLEYNCKHPILLPNTNLTRSIVEYIHRTNLHIGPQQLLAVVRKTYWPLGGKNMAKKIYKECVLCFRANPKPASQEMGILPKARVEPSRPFINTGVDYCGPFKIKNKPGRGGSTIKVYVAIFVCMAVKAVHIELVRDLTSEAFIAALKRFMARRGKVSHIYSDNGTNFVGSDNELRELMDLFQKESHQTMISEELASQKITWHFMPPNSPHFGGLWEAAVKSTKFHLRRVAANALMTYDELYTLLTQIEACLNSRPITPLSDDPNDYSYLTPGHFLIGEAITTNLEPDLTPLKINHLSRWQRIQQMFQQFWVRWKSEYLNQLQSRTKWTQEKDNIQIGDLVLLKEDTLPPLKWSLARIVLLHPGLDKKVRVVSVKTSRGIFKRNITSICPFPKNVTTL